MPSLTQPPAQPDALNLESTWILDDVDALWNGRGRDESPADYSTSSAATSYSQSMPPTRVVEVDAYDSETGPFALLRARLMATSWLLTGGLCLLFFYQFACYQLTPRSLGAVTLVATLGGAVLLSGRREMSAVQLRVLETAIFGITGIQLASTQLEWLVQAAIQRDATGLTWSAWHGTCVFAVLILTYGMVMPNGWKRTACMLFPAMLAPIATLQSVRMSHSFAAQAIPIERVCELGAYMVGAWGVALFGTWTISSLRQDYRRALRFGQYRLKQRIGHGGMGEVYLAEHRLLKRPCALKLIRVNQVQDPQSLARFEREVRATARLSHWNTVEIYDYGHTDDGTFYYVMEYLPGLNLSELVRRFGPLHPARVVHFLIQTCDALAEAHAAGLIHRDLKPANIFASQRGGIFDVTKLLDFGLVLDDNRPELLLSSDAERVGKFTGSPLYMSPEQAGSDLPPDPRSDLYSLGATGYCLLTGHPPFEGRSPLRLMIAHARDPVTPPSRFEPGIPQDLEEIILRCLAKHPSRRYANVRELRNALANCSVASEWTAERAAQWWQRHAPALETTKGEPGIVIAPANVLDHQTVMSRS